MGKWHNEFLSCDKNLFPMILEWLLSKRFLKHIAQNVSDDVRLAETASPGIKTGWQKFTDALTSGVSNWWKGFTGSGLTQRDVDLNAMNMQNVEDTASAQVAGYQKAGVNPALMFGNGASNSAPQASATGSVGNMSELMQMLLIPEQKALMRAQAVNLQSSAKKNEAQTEKIGEEIGLVRSRIENSGLDAQQKKIALRYQDEFARADLAIKGASADNLRASYDSTMESIRKMKFEELSHVFGYLETIEKISVMEKSKDLTDAQIKELGALTDKLNAERRYINLQSDNFDFINGFVTNASIGVGPFKGSQSGVITLADLKRGVRAAMEEREEPDKGKHSDSQESWQDMKRKASDAYGALE